MRYLAVMRREWADSFTVARAAFVFGIAAVFFTLAFWHGTERTAAQAEAVAEAAQDNWAGWLAQEAKNPHSAAHYPMLLAKPPAPLGALTDGVEDALGAHVLTDAHRVVPVNGARASDMPEAQAVGSLDAAFVVAVVLSLLAVLFGVDVVAGERERGTLRLLFANPIGRRRWLAAKLAARATAFLGLIGLGAVAAWVISGGVPLGVGWPWRLAGLAGVSAVYLTLWLGLGALCSTLTARVAPAALAGIALWVGLVVVGPRVLTAVAEQISPPPATAPARMAMRVTEVKLRQEQAALVEAAHARGELKGASAVVATEGSGAIRNHIDAKAARARAEAESASTAWRGAQLDRLGRLAYLTPTALYMQVASGVAGTDWHRHVEFLQAATRYRQAFLDELNGLEDRGVTEFSAFERMRRFTFDEASASAVAGRMVSPVLTLVLMASLAFFAALGIFRRYDLR